MGIDIDTYVVTCPETGEKLLRFTKEHAQKVGYESLTQFKKKNKLNYSTLPQRSRSHLKRLYNIDFSRWVVGYRESTNGDMRYVTKIYEPYTDSTAKAASKFPMSDGMFNAHFRGESPLAIFAYGTRSRWFAFDVDSKEKALDDTLKLVDTLVAQGISRKDIHVSYSGGKGYHVELFTDKHLPFSQWQAFGHAILGHAGLSTDQIEFRPTENNSHALKLPLTLHPKTGNFAGYCRLDCNNRTLEVLGVQDSHDYLATIEQIGIEAILAVEPLPKMEAPKPSKPSNPKPKAVRVVEPRLFKSDDDKKTTAIKILSEGLPGPGTRWKSIRNTLIPYLKAEMGCDEEKTREILIDFCKREYEAGRTTTPIEQCIKEIDKLIEGFYPLVNGVYSVVRELEVTKSEVEWVVGVVEIGGKRTARDLLWALLLLKKAYANKEGEFFASREAVQALLSNPRKISPSTIQTHRKWLSDNGYLEFEVPKNYYTQRKATIYKLSYEEIDKPEVVDQVHFSEDMDGRDLLKQITKRLYASHEIKVLKLA